MTRFTIDVDGVRAVAELHTDAALLSGIFEKALPIEGSIRHVRWSGEAVYLIDHALEDLTPLTDQLVSIFTPGAIVLRPVHGELVLSYGQSQARDEYVTGALGTHLATVVEGLEPYLERLRQVRFTGVCPISFALEGE